MNRGALTKWQQGQPEDGLAESGDTFTVEVPAGSGIRMNLAQAASELSRRLVQLFLPDRHGYRACHGQRARFATDPHWRDLILFSEDFHGDNNGRGCGASHQTGWTALVAPLIRKFGSGRSLSVAGAMQSATAGTT